MEKNKTKDNPGAYCKAIEQAIKEGILPAVPPSPPPKNLNLEEYLDYELLRNRTLLFHGEVRESTAKQASKRLEYLGKLSKKPIRVILNSVGGGVYDGSCRRPLGV